MKKEEKATEVIHIRLTPNEKKVIEDKVEKTGLTVSAFCRKILAGYEPKQRLSPEERKLADNIDTLTETVKKFNNALKGWTKDMTKEDRNKFILNGKTLGTWSEIVVEIYQCEKELLEKLD